MAITTKKLTSVLPTVVENCVTGEEAEQQKEESYYTKKSKQVVTVTSSPMKPLAITFSLIIFGAAITQSSLHSNRSLVQIQNNYYSFIDIATTLEQITSSSYSTTSTTIDDDTILSQTIKEEEKIQHHNVGTAVEHWSIKDQIEKLLLKDPLLIKERRRLVVSAVKGDDIDIADNFAQTLLKQYNVNNFVLIPLDAVAYDILKDAYPHHTLSVIPSYVMQETIITQPFFIRKLLELDYTVFYNDINMLWNQDSWLTIDSIINESSAMFWLHDDDDNDGRPSSEGELCSCMMYFKPNQESLSFLNTWEEEIKTGLNDQDALNKVAYDLDLISDYGGDDNNDNNNIKIQVLKNNNIMNSLS